MQRMGMVINVKGEHLDEYRRIHAAVWPEVLDIIAAANITNYSIFLKEPENMLFAYWEYVGTDFAADMRKLGEEPAMKRWWAVTDPMQLPFATRGPGEWWASMPSVFYTP